MAQLPPQPPPESVALSKFKGLRNTLTAERLSPEELEIAVNIDLDDAGQAHRRRGYRQVDSHNYAALWTRPDGQVLAVCADGVFLVNPDYSRTSLGSAIGTARCAFVDVGPSTYISNGVAAIRVDISTGWADRGVGPVYPWGIASGQDTWLSPVVNPTATLTPIAGRLLGPPPMATAMDYLNGRIYMANDRTVWATELFLYDYVDKTKNFMMFEAKVTMIGAVPDGLYVGTAAGLWFLSGPFKEMKRALVHDHPVIPGTMVKVRADLANPAVPLDQFSPDKNGILFMTSRGVCVGMESGQVFNKTEGDLWFPVAVSGAAMFRQQDGMNTFVAVLDSGGTPADAGRIGDHIDVELRRPGDWGYLADGVFMGDTITVDTV